ncbi:MAG TPA: hypothetical protein VHE30_02530 [Polyangiaceae bacterium]|nr:hypothetical protein [Polyangiaceae bacterium]
MPFLGLTFGEAFIVVFIVVAVVSAPYWPRMGAAIAVAIVGKNAPRETPAPGEPSKPDAS